MLIASVIVGCVDSISYAMQFYKGSYDYEKRAYMCYLSINSI